MLLGAAVLSFGLFNVHSQSRITEGGILGLTLFLHHWTSISPGIFSFLLDMTCYIIGFRLLGTDFLKNAIFSTFCYALLYRFWEFTGPFLPSYADKPLIAAILGGLFVGIGAGLIVRRGGASGGDDALALILHQVTGWKISRSYFFTDFVVLMLSISYIPLRNIFFSGHRRQIRHGHGIYGRKTLPPLIHRTSSGRPQAAPTKTIEPGCRGGLWPPASTRFGR